MMNRVLAMLVGFMAVAGVSLLWTASRVDAQEPKPKPVLTIHMGSLPSYDYVILHDHETGCQYIARYRMSITPRMNAEGKQVCVK